MENDSTALDAIKIRSPRMTKALEGWDQLRKLTLKEAQRKILVYQIDYEVFTN